MPEGDRHIVGIGGWPWEEYEHERRLQEFLLGLARGRRVCLVPTASAEDPSYLLLGYERWGPVAEVTHVRFFPWPREDLRQFLLAQDLVVVGGGNTANMLAIWRMHGFDDVLREAWAAGVVLSGWSAGMVCWFEACVTDSFGPSLTGMRDGLGLLGGSACPHYDGEELRRPCYRRYVAQGFPAGYAADDGVALHFAGTELAEVVSVREGATGYRVEPGNETPLECRVL
ncbi:MAG: Type 1 glutamine amidotransferase-like domain-containing protein [Gaiellaceae bacterium]